ncbi:GAF domain-containing protein [Oxalobacteraceae bacterium OM1]|nr:GAF domain-containing protein [Oxalobacteraceae bacterium OM1]
MKDSDSEDVSGGELMSPRAAADLLAVSAAQVQHWIASGELPHRRTPGGHKRLHRADVQAFAGTVQRPASAPDSLPVSEYCPDPCPAYPLPSNERERLWSLAVSNLIDSPREPVFDALTARAVEIARTPMGLVSLLTARRQWFKAKIGVAVDETPRAWAFCSHAILGDDPFIVTDAHRDRRFAGNPLVTGEPHLRFYAGFPLAARDGTLLGTLCVLDRKPRRLNAAQIAALRGLAAQAAAEIVRRT